MITMIGIDPSLTATGYAHTDGSLNTYITNKTESDERLLKIYVWITGLLKVEHPTYAVIEAPYEHGTASARTGMVHGIIRLALLERSIQYREIPPSTLKKFATGRGTATKPDMRMSLYQRTGLDVRDDNQVDAAWLRWLGLYMLGGTRSFELPKTHTIALDKVEKWR